MAEDTVSGSSTEDSPTQRLKKQETRLLQSQKENESLRKQLEDIQNKKKSKKAKKNKSPSRSPVKRREGGLLFCHPQILVQILTAQALLLKKSSNLILKSLRKLLGTLKQSLVDRPIMWKHLL